MREFAEGFYKGKTWKKTRKLFIQQKGGLCEMCLSRGIYKPADIVHHKIHITPENINDPNITLDFNNLMGLCRECHAEQHKKKDKSSLTKRFGINPQGKVTCKK